MDKTADERIRIEIRKPLVNENLEENSLAKETIELMQDENKLFDLHIYVDAFDMIPTATVMSMSKRHNVEYYAHISNFPGCEYIYGYLKSSYFKEVELIEHV